MVLGTRRPARRPAEKRQQKQQKKGAGVSPAPDALSVESVHVASDVAGADNANIHDVENNAVKILRLAHDGRGVARAGNGKTVFVEGALPGERVRIRIHRQHKRYDEAHVAGIDAYSPHRVTPRCQHFTQCGGCSLQHLDIGAQRTHKSTVLREHLQREKIAIPDSIIISDAPYHYRRRARLGVKTDSQGNIHFGFRRAQSDRLFNIEQCPVLVPALEALLVPIRELLEQLVSPRSVGHVELIAGDGGDGLDSCAVEALEASDVMLCIRQLKVVPEDEARWECFARSQGVRLFIDRADSVNPPEMQYGLKLSTKVLELGFQPGNFIQVNARVNQKLVSAVREWLALDPDEKVLDLFSGVGNFSLPLASSGVQVNAIEGSPAMVDRLRLNAMALGLQVEASAQDLTQAPDLDGYDAVVLDPPRDGAQNVAVQLSVRGPSRVAYVSCDPATLARDAAVLQQGGYRLERLALVDMFPQTAHLESLSLFVRN